MTPDINPNIHSDMLSKCCHWPYESVCADEGTCHAECTKCGQECDLESPTNNEQKLAIRLVNELLEESNVDPDDNLRILSRQFLRQIERTDAAYERAAMEVEGMIVPEGEYLDRSDSSKWGIEYTRGEENRTVAFNAGVRKSAQLIRNLKSK